MQSQSHRKLVTWPEAKGGPVEEAKISDLWTKLHFAVGFQQHKSQPETRKRRFQHEATIPDILLRICHAQALSWFVSWLFLSLLSLVLLRQILPAIVASVVCTPVQVESASTAVGFATAA